MMAFAGVAVLLSGVAAAQDNDGKDIGTLLDSIPTIEDRDTKEDEPKKAADPGAMTAYANFVRATQVAVLRNWKPKSKALRQHPDWRVRALVQVDASGALLGATIVESNGDKAFEASTLKAVKKTATVDAPPAEILDRVKNGVLVDFAANMF